MGERVVGFSFDTIVFIVLILIIAILFSAIFINTNKVEEKADIVGAPGVVRVDSIEIKYTDLDDLHKSLRVIMTGVEHEEGKILDVVPVISSPSTDPILGDFVYRPISIKENEEGSYPNYVMGDDTTIEGYYQSVYIKDFSPGDTIHLSLWEAPCLEKIGFTKSVSWIIFYNSLVKKCSGSYLGAWSVKPKPAQTGISEV